MTPTRRSFIRATALPPALLAACGAPPAPPPTGPSAPPVTLRLTSWLTAPPSVEAYDQHLIAPFQAELPRTTVAVERMAFDVYPEKLQSYSASGDLPDLFEMSFAWFPEWVKLGWPENLDAAIKRDRINLADYDKTVIGMGRWPYLKGPSYSWWTMMGVGTFYYNKAMFDREGQRYPDASWTWEGALEVAKRLTRPGQQWGLQLASYTDGLIYAYGGQVLNEDGTRCLLDSAESIRAHQFWADLFLKHRVSATSAELKDAGVQGDPFAAGKIGMYLHGSYPVGQFRRDIKDFEWEIAPSPAGPAGRAVSVAGNPSHAVAAAGRQKERAWEFLRWWVTRQNAKQVVNPGNIPTRLAAAQEWVREEQKSPLPKNMALIVEAAQQYGKRSVTGVRWAEWNKVWGDTRGGITGGSIPVEQGLKAATREIDRILQG